MPRQRAEGVGVERLHDGLNTFGSDELLGRCAEGAAGDENDPGRHVRRGLRDAGVEFNARHRRHHHVTEDHVEVVFAEQSDPGLYRLVIGPNIEDLGGNPMDQDDDDINGEDPDDQFEATFTLEAGPQYVGRFDFGTGSSPVAQDYTRVSMWDYYDAADGWGWTGWVIEMSRSGADPLTRDFNYTENATFSVDVANGEYDVVVTLGDSALAHDQMGVFLEGVQVDTVTTASGQFAVNTYRTTVTDGQLSLLLDDLGGSDKWVMINALDVILLPGGGAQSVSSSPPPSTTQPTLESLPVDDTRNSRPNSQPVRGVDRIASRPNPSLADGFFASLSKGKQEQADEAFDIIAGERNP